MPARCHLGGSKTPRNSTDGDFKVLNIQNANRLSIAIKIMGIEDKFN